MSRRKGPLHYIEIAILALLCITIGALITLLLGFVYNFQTTGSYVRLLVPHLIGVSLDAVVPTLIVTGFLSVVFCYVIIRAVVRFRRQKGSYGTERAAWGRIVSRRRGLLHYIEIAVRILLCTPIGALITFLLSAQYNVLTPGMYAAMKLVPDTGREADWLAPLIPRLVVAGFVNVICCYAIIVALVAVVTRLRGQKGPAAPSGVL